MSRWPFSIYKCVREWGGLLVPGTDLISMYLLSRLYEGTDMKATRARQSFIGDGSSPVMRQFER